jgi:CheY-like chemotaxis protein
MKKSYNYILIDDNELDVYVNKGLLELSQSESKVYTFLSCMEAMNFISNNVNSFNSKRNILLLDVQMPDISGFECLQKYLDLDESVRKKTNIILLSSTIDEHDTRKARQNPLVAGIIEKPLVYEILEKKLEKLNP